MGRSRRSDALAWVVAATVLACAPTDPGAGALPPNDAPQATVTDEPEHPCEVQLDDEVALLDQTVTIQPPRGVTFQAAGPTQARSSSAYVAACDAHIDQAFVFAFPNDATKSLEDVTQSFTDSLAQQGRPTDPPTVRHHSPTDTHVALRSADGFTWTYVAAIRRPHADHVYLVVYEAEAAAFATLTESFERSALSLMFTGG